MNLIPSYKKLNSGIDCLTSVLWTSCSQWWPVNILRALCNPDWWNEFWLLLFQAILMKLNTNTFFKEMTSYSISLEITIEDSSSSFKMQILAHLTTGIVKAQLVHCYLWVSNRHSTPSGFSRGDIVISFFIECSLSTGRTFKGYPRTCNLENLLLLCYVSNHTYILIKFTNLAH